MSIPPKPLFNVIPCCLENGTSAQINLDGLLAAGTGVYTYNGAADLPIAGTDVILVPGECYYINPSGSIGNVTEVPLADLAFVIGDRCESPSATAVCPACDPPGTFYIKAEPCCGGDPIFFKGEGYEGGTGVMGSGNQLEGAQQPAPAIPPFSVLDFNGVYLFEGPGEIEGLTIGQCYTFSFNTVEDATSEVTPAEYLVLGYPPFISELEYVDKNDCDGDADGDGIRDCPDCPQICYTLISCTGVFINTISDLSAHVGTYIEIDELPGTFLVQLNEGLCENPIPVITYTGPAPEDCPCICYEVLDYAGAISYVDCDGVSQVTYGPAKFCAIAPPFIRGKEGIDYTLVTGTDCIDGECAPECYILTNCEPAEYPDQDAVLNSTLQSLSQYANTNEVVVLAGYEGCWTVTTATCNCITITIDGTVIETTLLPDLYNDHPVFSFEYDSITYVIWYDGIGTWVISTEEGVITGRMGDAESEDPCPVTSGTLAWGVGSAFSGIISTITTELCPEQCNCPVDVTVIRDHEDCEDCLGITAYKLTNCEKINEVVYTTQDLSAFVGQVLKDDCNCWTVEEIDYQPPSETTIVDPFLYTDCTSCLTAYYQLDNCDPAATPLQIITSTDLSDSVGQVIKIENCDDCFTVSEYTDDPEPENWEEVTLVETFADCPTCQELTPQCSTVFNNSTVDRTYSYIDVNGNLQETEIVRSGHTSLRYCVQRWTLTEECTCLTVTIRNTEENTIEVIEAVATGAIYTGRRVYSFEYDGTTYEIWYDTSFPGSEGWYITGSAGSFAPPFLGSALNTIECPIIGSLDDPFNTDPDGWESALEGLIITTTACIVPIYNYCGDCSVYNDGEGGQTGFCVQYFPNNRKVKPGYNTPICSADKYDKITCKFAEIAYKKVLELRYGISNCCPEEDEKWLIKKELIELQALTDPNYTCDPLTDCCGNPASQCSCNS